MKRGQPILATEVVPGKVYLAPHRVDGKVQLRPATVKCTAEPGYLRGFADIRVGESRSSHTSGYVTLEFIEPDINNAEVPVFRCQRLNDGIWTFAVGPDKYHPLTLHPLPERWFEQKVHDLQQQMNALTLQISQLEDQRMILRLVKKQIDALNEKTDA